MAAELFNDKFDNKIVSNHKSKLDASQLNNDNEISKCQSTKCTQTVFFRL